MRIAVTGATGHIGANLLPALCKAGHDITILYRNEEKLFPFENLYFNKVRGDILNSTSLSEAFKDVEIVIHLAAVISINGDKNGMVMRTNVQGVENVVNACKSNNVKKLIHLSSIHALKYDAGINEVNEGTDYANENSFSYDYSKALGEKIVEKAIEDGLNATILRPTGIIGPNDFYQSLSGTMLKQMIRGKLPAIVKGGFDWVDVRDIVKVISHIVENDVPSKKYILSGHFLSFKDLTKVIQKIADKKIQIVEVPIWLAIAGLPFIRLIELLNNKPPLYTKESLLIIKNSAKKYSHALAQRELGYCPTPIEDTIKDIANWLLLNKC